MELDWRSGVFFLSNIWFFSVSGTVLSSFSFPSYSLSPPGCFTRKWETFFQGISSFLPLCVLCVLKKRWKVWFLLFLFLSLFLPVSMTAASRR